MADKKRILVLQPNYQSNSEIWLQRMTFFLQDNIISIGAFNPNENKWRNKIPVFDLGKPHYSLLKRLMHRISPNLLPPPKKLIEKQLLNKIQSADILLIHFIGPAIYFKKVIEKINIPVFIHVHGADIFWDLKKINPFGESYYNDIYIEQVREIGKHVCFISNSNFSTNKLLQIGIPQLKIKMKYFGVPEQKILHKSENSIPIILFLGRLVDFKGPDQVIKAFELTRKKGCNARLIIAGDGPLKVTCELLRHHSKYAADIDILGEVNYKKAEELYHLADIYTMHNIKGPLTNQEEAFGVSIIEAMSYGLPVVTAKSGAVCETVVHNETGIIIEPYDIEAHAEALISLVCNYNKRRKMGEAGKKRIKETFSVEAEEKQLKEILGIIKAWCT